MSTYRLGVDIGGTFTDIVLLGANGAMHTKKILSTPQPRDQFPVISATAPASAKR